MHKLNKLSDCILRFLGTSGSAGGGHSSTESPVRVRAFNEHPQGLVTGEPFALRRFLHMFPWSHMCDSTFTLTYAQVLAEASADVDTAGVDTAAMGEDDAAAAAEDTGASEAEDTGAAEAVEDDLGDAVDLPADLPAAVGDVAAAAADVIMVVKCHTSVTTKTRASVEGIVVKP